MGRRRPQGEERHAQDGATRQAPSGRPGRARPKRRPSRDPPPSGSADGLTVLAERCCPVSDLSTELRRLQRRRIGDLHGIAEHLDYLAWLGVTATWLNPCFVSPMRDAGYDIADYLAVDPRYGDNHVLAELAGRGSHTRHQAPARPSAGTHLRHSPVVRGLRARRGRSSLHLGRNRNDGRLPDRFVRSPGSRPGGYLPNFFDFQPALNFGYARQNAHEPWRQNTDGRRPPGQSRGVAHDHRPLATAGRVRVPGRHGLLAGQR